MEPDCSHLRNCVVCNILSHIIVVVAGVSLYYKDSPGIGNTAAGRTVRLYLCHSQPRIKQLVSQVPVSAADRFSLPRVRFTAGYTFIAYRRHFRSIQVQCVHGTYDTVHHSSDNRISSTQEAPKVISCRVPPVDNHYNIHPGNPLVDSQEHLRLVMDCVSQTGRHTGLAFAAFLC